jgi:hypothetical protein
MKPEVIQDFLDSVKNLGCSFRIENFKNKYDHYERSYNNYACINIFIHESFTPPNDNSLNGFITKCETFFLPLASLYTASSITQLIVFTDFLNKKLRFEFYFIGDILEYINAFEGIFNVIEKYRLLKNFELEKKIEKHFSPSDNYINLSYKNNEWEVKDPLVNKIRKSSIDYKDGKDFRINKPNVKMNENSHSELFTFEHKWTLNFDKLYITMFKPNDVSLYSNISDKNLKEAKDLYHKLINPDDFFLNSAYPNENTQIEYFNYFEKIIQSIIFAFTSIEALLNLCLEEDEIYNWSLNRFKSKKEFTSQEVEKLFPFDEKIKLISKQILSIPDEECTDLINIIIDLKTIRDEIIHAKPSKSEDRYSKFLQVDIFKIIESHKEFILTIGVYIFKNQKYLLNDFPYNFGQDEFFPNILSDEESIQLFNDLHRPSSNST